MQGVSSPWIWRCPSKCSSHRKGYRSQVHKRGLLQIDTKQGTIPPRIAAGASCVSRYMRKHQRHTYIILIN